MLSLDVHCQQNIVYKNHDLLGIIWADEAHVRVLRNPAIVDDQGRILSHGAPVVIEVHPVPERSHITDMDAERINSRQGKTDDSQT